MNIFVCVKQVPDTEAKIKLASDSVDFAGIKWIINPYDQNALEEAIKFKSANPSAIITAITVGPKARAKEALITAVAMGADEGVIVDSTDLLDSFLAAKALSGAIKSVGAPHLVLTGKLSIDDNQSSVSQMVAEHLNIPHCTVVSKIEYTAGELTAEREIEGGNKEIVSLKFPCLVAANKGLNNPRYPSLPGIMKAKKKVFKELSLADVGCVETDAKSILKNFSLPPDRPDVKMLAGDSGAQVSQLIKLLREESKVI